MYSISPPPTSFRYLLKTKQTTVLPPQKHLLLFLECSESRVLKIIVNGRGPSQGTGGVLTFVCSRVSLGYSNQREKSNWMYSLLRKGSSQSFEAEKREMWGWRLGDFWKRECQQIGVLRGEAYALCVLRWLQGKLQESLLLWWGECY